MLGRKGSVRLDSEATWLSETLRRVELRLANEQEQEALANWLLESSLYYAYLESSDDPQEIAVITTERLWDSVLKGKLTWRDETGLSGLLRYVRQAVRFEIGRRLRTQTREWAAVVPLEDALERPAPTDVETEVVERLTWDTLTTAVRAALEILSPQQQQAVQLRLEGLEPREIAEALNIPRTQANVVLSQAYARLRAYLLQQAQTDLALAETLQQVFNIDLTEASHEG